MKSYWNSKYFKIGLTALLVICGGILFYYLLFFGSNVRGGLEVFYNIMMPVFFGAIMAYLLRPAVTPEESAPSSRQSPIMVRIPPAIPYIRYLFAFSFMLILSGQDCLLFQISSG